MELNNIAQYLKIAENILKALALNILMNLRENLSLVC